MRCIWVSVELAHKSTTRPLVFPTGQSESSASEVDIDRSLHHRWNLPASESYCQHLPIANATSVRHIPDSDSECPGHAQMHAIFVDLTTTCGSRHGPEPAPPEPAGVVIMLPAPAVTNRKDDFSCKHNQSCGTDETRSHMVNINPGY
eukprot:2175842-Rhodomonas_salina.1